GQGLRIFHHFRHIHDPSDVGAAVAYKHTDFDWN
ncbi:MAG: hypothetical protein H6Q48_4186, partial [Deltaproteobacteria bacterium]|nr:hypothetical protein [Deltaproteobacteria bacterium]